MESPKYYLVVDLEATCDENHAIPRHETEIIEIGAVLCDGETLLAVDEWQTFVRPFRHPRLTPFCTQLTSITQDLVERAPPFRSAISALGRWLDGRAPLFCSWGDYDRNQLTREASQHGGLRLPLGARHLNLKESFCLASGESKKLGVGQALRRCRLHFEGTAHRGIDDARNIARLLPYALGRVAIPAR